MGKVLQKDFNFSYTVEQLTLLEPIYLAGLEDDWEDEFYTTQKKLHTPIVNMFINWLSEEDRTKLL